MTSLIEKVVAIIAPHCCLLCGIEHNVLCDGCIESSVTRLEPFCVLCIEPSADWRICRDCRGKTALSYVWVGARNEAVVEKLIRRFKFERVRQAYQPLAHIIATSLPYGDWAVVPIPTAPTRVRQRGYDQAFLLAQELARNRQLPVSRVLQRANSARQVGAGRAQRLAQSQNAFYLTRSHEIKGKHILLVDDICTTGATLTAAAAILKAAGAKDVSAAVAAWQPLKQEKTS